MDMKNTLRALCEAFGPTGRETRVAGIIEDMVKDYADEIRHGQSDCYTPRQGQAHNAGGAHGPDRIYCDRR